MRVVNKFYGGKNAILTSALQKTSYRIRKDYRFSDYLCYSIDKSKNLEEHRMTVQDIPVFLSKKFAPNLLPEVCAPRQSLLKVYNQAADFQFIYVGAPAGSGKTVSTLLWLNSCKKKTVWIGLDSYDNAPSVFYKQLASGLYSLQPDNESMRAVLVSQDFAASPVEHTISLIAEMHPFEEHFALVLDDLHLITNGEILKSLPAVMNRLPLSFVTLILSRHAMPDEFSFLVKDSKTQIITPDHLRFTEHEIRRYFASVGRFLTESEARFVRLATDGWAIGINAMSKSGQLKDGGDGYDFSAYFKEQLWDKWAQDLKDFCLATSIVDEFNPEMATALSGREDAKEVMDHLSRTNSFLSLLHDDTYRYHHLFQDFLRSRLSQEGAGTKRLYKTAADYYREHGDYTRALKFSLDSGDFKNIDTYLYLFLFENHRGSVADYAEFLRPFFEKDFPPRAYKESPVLHVLSAWYYYLTSRHEEFSSHMDSIILNLPRIAKVNSTFVEFAMLAFSVDYRTTVHKKIKQFSTFGRFVKKYTPEGLATSIASFTHNLPYIHRSNFDYSDLALPPDVLDNIDHTFAPLLGAEWAYLKPTLRASFLFEQNEMGKALDMIHFTLNHLSEESKIEGRISVILLKHSILWQLNEKEEAQAVFHELTALVKREAQFFLPNLKAYETQLELLDGNTAAARAWLENYFVVETDHVELFRAFQHFTTARAYLALGESEQATHYLQLLEDYGKNLNRPLDAAEAGVLLSVLKWNTGQKKESARLLLQIMEDMQPYGFIRIIANEGRAVLPVIKRVISMSGKDGYDGPLTKDFASEVLLAAHAMSKLHKGMFARSATDSSPIKLSRQQTKMISLLAKGYRNAEISELTGLAIPTIKSHTSIAYQKLGVNNALDAVLTARELGMIE